MIKEEDIIEVLSNMNAVDTSSAVKFSEIMNALREKGLNPDISEVLDIIAKSDNIGEYNNLYYLVM